ncbi:Modification methylase AplI [compost metagenome]
MKPAAYYNEIDPFAAQWLRNLIAAGHIAPGDVDERSIVDVKADDLKNYTQCHFFAGIGVWSYSLRLAGWPDDRPVWTGSCPCQPFSVAGKQGGKSDERHLAPIWLDLIKECQPAIIFGEQVAAAIGKHWLDDLFAELEKQGYACGAAVLPACSVGAPHIRQRLWFTASGVAVPNGIGWGRREVSAQGGEHHREITRREQGQHGAKCRGETGINRLADAEPSGFGASSTKRPQQDKCDSETPNNATTFSVSSRVADTARQCGNGCRNGGAPGRHEHSECCDTCRMGNPNSQPAGRNGGSTRSQEDEIYGQSLRHGNGSAHASGALRPGPVNGFWGSADWLYCRDEKWRPVEPQSFPLVDGATARVGRLRAYGNAINAENAKAFITACMEITPDE